MCKSLELLDKILEENDTGLDFSEVVEALRKERAAAVMLREALEDRPLYAQGFDAAVEWDNSVRVPALLCAQEAGI